MADFDQDKHLDDELEQILSQTLDQTTEDEAEQSEDKGRVDILSAAETKSDDNNEFDYDSESIAEDFLVADFDLSSVTENIADEEAEVSILQKHDTEDSASTSELDTRFKQLEVELLALQQQSIHAQVPDKDEQSPVKISSEPPSESNQSKAWRISAVMLAGIALLVALGAGVISLDLRAHIVDLQAKVLDVENKLAVLNVAPGDKKNELLQTRIDELGALVDSLQLAEAQKTLEREQQSENIKLQLLAITEKLKGLENKTAKPVAVKKKRRYSQSKKVVSKSWVVNLVSFKQRWYTDKKVEEFKQQGVPVEVYPVDVKGVKWFRIRVAGFKDKAAAEAYAIKVKGVLNLGSVWVSK